MAEVGTKSVFPGFTLGIHLKDSSLLSSLLSWVGFGFVFFNESRREV